LKVLGFI
jgi:hypothetical protein